MLSTDAMRVHGDIRVAISCLQDKHANVPESLLRHRSITMQGVVEVIDGVRFIFPAAYVRLHDAQKDILRISLSEELAFHRLYEGIVNKTSIVYDPS